MHTSVIFLCHLSFKSSKQSPLQVAKWFTLLTVSYLIYGQGVATLGPRQYYHSHFPASNDYGVLKTILCCKRSVAILWSHKANLWEVLSMFLGCIKLHAKSINGQ